MDIFHVLEDRNKRVLLRGRGYDPGHGQHIVFAARFEFHIVHEILQAHSVQNAVGIDEENEEIIVLLQVFRINLVDKPEGQFLTMPLSSMFESRDGNSSALVGNIDTLRVYFEEHGDPKVMGDPEIGFVNDTSVI